MTMPKLAQGNIFAAVADRRADLAIIFGHIGFNAMYESWRAFSESVPSLSGIRDPFSEIGGRACPISDDQWLWFVAEHEGQGMTDTQLMPDHRIGVCFDGVAPLLDMLGISPRICMCIDVLRSSLAKGQGSHLSRNQVATSNATIVYWIDTLAQFSANCTSQFFRLCQGHIWITAKSFVSASAVDCVA
ncbi:MAG: hypothetical protein NTV11_20335 [Rhodocyclales bacterium]|nr:hypothetical protein [Rhodocyclales bacterium]